MQLEQILSIVIPVVALAVVIRVLLTPIRWIFKLLCNSALGFLCLLLLNYFSEYTGVVFVLDVVNCLVAGIFGVPGVAVLALIEVFG